MDSLIKHLPLTESACNDVIGRPLPFLYLLQTVHEEILWAPDVREHTPEACHQVHPLPTILKWLLDDDEKIHVRCIVGIPSGLGTEQHDPDGIHLVYDRIDHTPEAIAEGGVRSESHNTV